MSIKNWTLRVAALAAIFSGVSFVGHSFAFQDESGQDNRNAAGPSILKPMIDNSAGTSLVPRLEKQDSKDDSDAKTGLMLKTESENSGVLLKPKLNGSISLLPKIEQGSKSETKNVAKQTEVVRVSEKVVKSQESTARDFPPVNDQKSAIAKTSVMAPTKERSIEVKQGQPANMAHLQEAISRHQFSTNPQTTTINNAEAAAPASKYIDAEKFQMQPVVQSAVNQSSGETEKLAKEEGITSKTSPAVYVEPNKSFDESSTERFVNVEVPAKQQDAGVAQDLPQIVIEQPELPVVGDEQKTAVSVADSSRREAPKTIEKSARPAENQVVTKDEVEVTVGDNYSAPTNVVQSPNRPNQTQQFGQSVRVAHQQVMDFPGVANNPTAKTETNERQVVQHVSGVEPVQQDDQRSPSDRVTPDTRYPNPNQNRQGITPPGFRLGPDGRLIPDPTFPGDPRLADPMFRQRYGIDEDGTIARDAQMPGNLDPFAHPYSDVPAEYLEDGSLAGFSDCGMVCGASKYAIVEFLNFDRNERTIVAANFRGAEFGRTDGWRFTLGEKYDSFTGREFVYQGFDPWVGVSQRTANGQLTTILTPSNGISLNAISHLRFANWMEQFQKTDLHSLEFNRVRWYWDVAKSFWGVRYFHLEDEYRLSSVNIINQAGTYDIETANRMLGLQWGTSLAYDIGCRLSLSGWTKIGGYANFSKGRIGLNNSGTQVINNSDEDTDFAATFELGIVAHYQLAPRARIRAGYEILNFWDIMTASGNYDGTITGNSGLDMRSNDELLFDGLSVGFEFFR